MTILLPWRTALHFLPKYRYSDVLADVALERFIRRIASTSTFSTDRLLEHHTGIMAAATSTPVATAPSVAPAATTATNKTAVVASAASVPASSGVKRTAQAAFEGEAFHIIIRSRSTLDGNDCDFEISNVTAWAWAQRCVAESLAFAPAQ